MMFDGRDVKHPKKRMNQVVVRNRGTFFAERQATSIAKRPWNASDIHMIIGTLVCSSGAMK